MPKCCHGVKCGNQRKVHSGRSPGDGGDEAVLQLAAQLADPLQGQLEAVLVGLWEVPQKALLLRTEVPAADPGTAQVRKKTNFRSQIAASRTKSSLSKP